jgi:(1->4)-alpha-D-glucan 1-alpha-D-glucosylmutase
MEKALREAKIHTSWMNPAEAYEAAMRDYIGDLFSEKAASFTAELDRFVEQIADSGFVNSLAQAVFKMTLPGVPDFYQGTELWDFNLVDPDNRRPVDFEDRRRRLSKLVAEADAEPTAFEHELCARWPDSDIKLWVTARSLSLRREWPDVFTLGDYIPLFANGAAADHVIAFARRWDQNWALVVGPRHFYRLAGKRAAKKGQGPPQAEWADTHLLLPEEAPAVWRSVLFEETFEASGGVLESSLSLARLFERLPISLLTSAV